jgi:hypothetical protein
MADSKLQRRSAPLKASLSLCLLLLGVTWQELQQQLGSSFDTTLLPGAHAFPTLFVLRRANNVCTAQPVLGQFYSTHGVAANQPVSLDA